jgi:large subunit ribosomal protein L19e
MKMNVQKRLAAGILGCSEKRVKLDSERLAEIKEAITKVDIKGLINDNAITKKPVKGVSRARARVQKTQKRSGRRRGHGSRKGKANARGSDKKTWINQIRAQRTLLKQMKEKGAITEKIFRELYSKAKGGFFRSRKHLKLYIEERHLSKK